MADKNGLDRDSDELAQQFDRSAQMTASFSAELGRMQQSMLLTSREADSFANGVGGGLKRAFDGMIFDGMKLNDALKGIARGMADTAYSIAMKPIKDAVSNVIAQSIGGGEPVPFAKGGAAVLDAAAVAAVTKAMDEKLKGAI